MEKLRFYHLLTIKFALLSKIQEKTLCHWLTLKLETTSATEASPSQCVLMLSYDSAQTCCIFWLIGRRGKLPLASVPPLSWDTICTSTEILLFYIDTYMNEIDYWKHEKILLKVFAVLCWQSYYKDSLHMKVSFCMGGQTECSWESMSSGLAPTLGHCFQECTYTIAFV